MLELCPKVAVILDFRSTIKKTKQQNMNHLEVNIKSIPTE
jgi:hypothetical protein